MCTAEYSWLYIVKWNKVGEVKQETIQLKAVAIWKQSKLWDWKKLISMNLEKRNTLKQIRWIIQNKQLLAIAESECQSESLSSPPDYKNHITLWQFSIKPKKVYDLKNTEW